MNRQLGLLTLTIAASLATSFPHGLKAASPDQPRLTRIKNSVQLERLNSATRRASINDIVGEGTVVHTGNRSRGELSFPDETIVRLAANSAFDFSDGTRHLNLRDGAGLIQATKEANGATVHAGRVAASIAGTTVMIEYHAGVYKFLVLEGTARLYRPGYLGDSVLVRPGQMVFGNADAAVSDPVDFVIERFMKTSCLITDFPVLRSEKSIMAEDQKQQREKSKKTLVGTNMVIFGGGTQVSVVGQGQINTADRATTALVMPRRGRNLSPEAAPLSH
jgi:FecR protein